MPKEKIGCLTTGPLGVTATHIEAEYFLSANRGTDVSEHLLNNVGALQVDGKEAASIGGGSANWLVMGVFDVVHQHRMKLGEA